MTGVEDTESEDAAILADEEKLNPMGKVQLQRAQNALKIDQRATDQGIGQRIQDAAQEGDLIA